MYIRSQDRQELINFQNAYFSIQNNVMHVKPFYGNAIRIAEYDSQEICEQVLNEIEGMLRQTNSSNLIYRMPTREDMAFLSEKSQDNMIV